MNKFGKFVTVVVGATAVTAIVLDARGRHRRAKDNQKPYYENHHKPYGPYEKYVKRPLDCILASGALVVFSPILLITSLLVKKKLGSPVLFTQDRPGKDGKIFKLYKFWTMTVERDEKGELLPDEVRLTKFGEKLRSTSIDELPELINIAEGDMSIVGPRPLVPAYLPYYHTKELHRHDVRPGLTGKAQINGRSFISWEEIFAYDFDYVQRITFFGDTKIILQTAIKVFKRENIADVAKATYDENGKMHFSVDGKDYLLHQPLNVERGNPDA